MSGVALVDITGLCNVELNPLGPVHAYVVILPGPPVRLSEVPGMRGPLLDAVAIGVAGCALMIIFPDDGEVHPDALVTAKLYVFAANPFIVVLAPVPAIVPGLMVQLPEGNPLNTTLPVANWQVGCVIVPTTGAVGVTGCALMTTLPEAGETHPEALVTVKV